MKRLIDCRTCICIFTTPSPFTLYRAQRLVIIILQRITYSVLRVKGNLNISKKKAFYLQNKRPTKPYNNNIRNTSN